MIQKLKIIVRVQPRIFLKDINIFKVVSHCVRRIITSYLLLLLYASPVYAADPPCSNDPTTDIYKKFGPCPAGLTEIEGVIGNIISVVVGLGFVAMLVLLIWAGFKFLTSGGEPKALQTARQAATWAILGVFFMVIAWLILQLIESFTGVKVTVFDIRALCGDGGIEFCSPGP